MWPNNKITGPNVGGSRYLTVWTRLAARVARFWRMRLVLQISINQIIVGLLVILVLYVGTFTYWWQRSSVTIFTTKSGRHFRVIHFQFNTISYYTEPLWIPAFWFMEFFRGYKPGGFAGMEEQSILEYVKEQ